MFSFIKLHIFGVSRRHSGCSFPMRESGFELPVETDLELKQVATVSLKRWESDMDVTKLSVMTLKTDVLVHSDMVWGAYKRSMFNEHEYRV